MVVQFAIHKTPTALSKTGKETNTMTQWYWNPETKNYQDHPYYFPPSPRTYITDWLSDLNWPLIGLILAAVAIITAIVVGNYGYAKWTVDNFNGTVQNTVLCGSEKTHYCVVVAKDDGTEEVLENTDSVWWGKWNSADFQAHFEPNKKFHFTVYGWRIPFLTAFRNVVGAEPLENQ